MQLICTGRVEIISTFAELPALPQEFLTSSSAELRDFRKNISEYNSALAMVSVRAQFVTLGPRVTKYNPIIMVHGKMYHKIGALQPAVYIHDTKHATSNKMHFLEACWKIWCAGWDIY